MRDPLQTVGRWNRVVRFVINPGSRNVVIAVALAAVAVASIIGFEANATLTIRVVYGVATFGQVILALKVARPRYLAMRSSVARGLFAFFCAGAMVLLQFVLLVLMMLMLEYVRRLS